MEKLMKVLGVNASQMVHVFVAMFFMVAAMVTEDGMCLFMCTLGFFYGLYNYCKSIDIKAITE